ncbi:tetratricopeptide repeat-containing sulfotransferase family protein [Terricaulis sp.]|uniref:tetratricopeptide repeat-containing sulfotransferase family protein n=1 Tax=Terricaulis sp. TaxID=2768686 RepID=UPI002AC4D86C|nr:sulfotransferase [Terricaulis sp.]MDZ4689827.1 sulfotransferase [Terricaulis sp.]
MSAAASALVAEALKLLNADAAKAEALLRAALQADPRNDDAQLVLSEALRKKGDLVEALKFARQQVEARPQWFGAQRQLGIILGEQGEALAASLALKRAAELNPRHPTIWRELGDQLKNAGDAKGAQDAYAQYGAFPPEPNLRAAEAALQDNDAAKAEALLRAHLQRLPNDIVAIRLLSEAQARVGNSKDAEASLRRALDLAPGFGYARHALGQLLMGLGRLEEADAEAEKLLRLDSRNEGSRRLKAAILVALGENDQALKVYEKLLKDSPRHAGTWMSYGHVLKTEGRFEDGVEAYRRSVVLDPKLGVAWFSLANLKTFKFSDDDLKQMEAQLERADLSTNDRVNLLYALGKAHEDSKRVEAAFARYSEGAALYRSSIDYDPAWLASLVEATEKTLTKAFFAERSGGCEAQDPIFIVGLPRAGSTLLEQILASHSMVEGTMELGDVNAIVSELGGARDADPYVDKLPGLSADQRKALGETYLRTTRVQRKLGRPLFINKMPNDFRHIGLIHLILPNAKIIDARRHPMACGWSCFKQHFAMGQHYTYEMSELGAYYRNYVRLMQHYDEVLPGRVHRVIHEDLVHDPEPHIRALLQYCGLPFEEACLSPHETQRAVKTASSEQVRQPISAKGLDSWKPYEPCLGPLREALGDVVDFYPNAPPR